MENFSKPLATIDLPKSPTFLGNYCNGVKIFNFSCEIILGNFYWHLATFYWSHSPLPSVFAPQFVALFYCLFRLRGRPLLGGPVLARQQTGTSGRGSLARSRNCQGRDRHKLGQQHQADRQEVNVTRATPRAIFCVYDDIPCRFTFREITATFTEDNNSKYVIDWVTSMR